MVGIKGVIIVFMLAVCLVSNALTMSLFAKDFKEKDEGERLFKALGMSIYTSFIMIKTPSDSDINFAYKTL